MYKKNFKKTSHGSSNGISPSNSPAFDDISEIEQILSGKIPDRQKTEGDKLSPLSPTISPFKRSRRGGSQSNGSQQYLPFNNNCTYMETVLISAGLTLTNESSNILKTDQAMFIRNLNDILNKDRNASTNVEVFMKDFEKYHNENQLLITSLSSCVTADNNDVVAGTVQDSLVRLLLQVEILQPKLIAYLIDKLGEFSLEDLPIDVEPDSITWVRMIIQPLRFLNFVVDSKTLCERLFDIIYTATDNIIQQEIITCLPDIICDNDHYFATSELSKLLRSSFELTPSILDALNNLSVQNDIKNEVRQNMILTLHRAPADFLPIIVKFLVLTSDSQSYDKVVNGLRSELLSSRNISSTQRTQIMRTVSKLSTSELDQLHSVIFTNIRDGLLANKQLSEAWLRIISDVESHLDYKPIDIVALLILHDIANDATKKRAVDNVFRGRIKNEVLRLSLIEDTFEKFISIIREYYSSLLSILSKLLVAPDLNVNNFAADVYMCCFKYTTGHWCKQLINELLAYIGAGNMVNAQTALNILSDATYKYPEKIKPFSSILGILLNKLTDLTLTEVQQLMDMLCFIAFANCDDADTLSLQDELNIIIQKQLSSSKINVLRNGVLGAVMAIKHIATVPADESNDLPEKTDADDQQITLSERANKAYSILGMVVKGTHSNPEAQGLFFDQFSLMLMKCKDLDRTFLYQVSTVMKHNLKVYFLSAVTDIKPIDFMDVSPQFGLADEESIMVNLTPTLIEESAANQSSSSSRTYTTVLHSLFRMLRGLEYDDLSEIDALLDCPIMMPTFATTVKDFSNLSPEQQTVTMDSLFHLVNWFREVVNCFAYMVKDGNGDKVLIRLRTIIWLQNHIANCLPDLIVPDYCPPKCHFHTTVKKPNLPLEKKKPAAQKTAKKRKAAAKSQPEPSDTLNNTVVQSALPKTANIDESLGNTSAVDMRLYKHFFRDLDADVWILLTSPLAINPQPEQNCVFTPELGPVELLFILEDFISKLQLTLSPNTKRRNFKLSLNADIAASSCSLYISTPVLIIRNCIKLLPSLCSHMETIDEFFGRLLVANNDAPNDTGMFIPESRIIKKCLSYILKSMTILFSWEGLQSSSNEELFMGALQRINSHCSTQKGSNAAIKSLIKGAFRYLTGVKKSMLYLEAAVNYVSLLSTLNKYSGDQDVNKHISDICWQYLTQCWFDLEGREEKGANYNKNIETLLTMYFDNSSDKVKTVESVTDWLKEEANYLTNKDSLLKTLPTFNRSNLNILVRVVCKSLETAIKQNLTNNIDDKDKLSMWVTVTLALESLVTALRIQDLRPNLISFVKGSVAILKLFHMQGLTTCSLLFRTESVLVSQTLKKLQVTTRFIQNICNHSKVTEDAALSVYLPTVRSLLESIILKVKNMIVLNGCTEAFFMGSMRNKDLKGKELTSQSNYRETSDNEMEPEYEEENLEDEDNPETVMIEGVESLLESDDAEENETNEDQLMELEEDE